jgi:hypothetical protein
VCKSLEGTGDIFDGFKHAGALGALLRLFFFGIKLICACVGYGASAGGFLARFFLLVETSAILFSEARLTPRARVSSFHSLTSFSSIADFDE